MTSSSIRRIERSRPEYVVHTESQKIHPHSMSLQRPTEHTLHHTYTVSQKKTVTLFLTHLRLLSTNFLEFLHTTLSPRCNGRNPDGPGLPGFIEAKDDGSGEW